MLNLLQNPVALAGGAVLGVVGLGALHRALGFRLWGWLLVAATLAVLASGCAAPEAPVRADRMYSCYRDGKGSVCSLIVEVASTAPACRCFSRAGQTACLCEGR